MSPGLVNSTLGVARSVARLAEDSARLGNQHARAFAGELSNAQRARTATASVTRSRWAIPMTPSIALAAGIGLGVALLDNTQDRRPFTRGEKLGTAVTWGTAGALLTPLLRTRLSGVGVALMGAAAGLALGRLGSALLVGDDVGSGLDVRRGNAWTVMREAGSEGIESGSQWAVLTGMATTTGVLVGAAARHRQISARAGAVALAAGAGAAVAPTLMGFGWGAIRGTVDGAGMALGRYAWNG
jgi:hypothetical protein